MMITPAPVSRSAVKPMCPVISKPRPIPAEARAEEGAEANRQNEGDRARPRWRRIVVTRSRSLVRLNHICGGVRARSSPKPECEDRQGHYETFLSHNRRVPPVVSPI